jgi:hypothetical protein
MPDGLQTIDWRLERAHEHLTALDRERSTFLDQEHGGIVGEFDRDTTEYVFRFEGNLPDPRMPGCSPGTAFAV